MDGPAVKQTFCSYWNKNSSSYTYIQWSSLSFHLTNWMQREKTRTVKDMELCHLRNKSSIFRATGFQIFEGLSYRKRARYIQHLAELLTHYRHSLNIDSMTDRMNLLIYKSSADYIQSQKNYSRITELSTNYGKADFCLHIWNKLKTTAVQNRCVVLKVACAPKALPISAGGYRREFSADGYSDWLTLQSSYDTVISFPFWICYFDLISHLS